MKAIVAIARRQRANPVGLLHDEYGVEQPDDLSLSQAIAFIDLLKAVTIGCGVYSGEIRPKAGKR